MYTLSFLKVMKKTGYLSSIKEILVIAFAFLFFLFQTIKSSKLWIWVGAIGVITRGILSCVGIDASTIKGWWWWWWWWWGEGYGIERWDVGELTRLWFGEWITPFGIVKVVGVWGDDITVVGEEGGRSITIGCCCCAWVGINWVVGGAFAASLKINLLFLKGFFKIK